MSLMNDALRKKDRELAGDQVAPGFSVGSRGPGPTRKWVTVLAVAILLTAAALVGIQLVQSAPGDALLLKSASPAPSSPRKRPIDSPSAAIVQAREPLAEQSTTDASPETAPATDTPIAPGPATDSASTAQAIAAANDPTLPVRSHTPVAARVVASPPMPIEKPVDQPSKASQVVARTFEPGPGPEADHQTTRPAESVPPLPTEPSVPSPVPGQSTVTGGRLRADKALLKTTPPVERDNLFYKKALAYHRSGRLADAVRLYRQVLASDADHPGAMLNLSGAYMQQGNYVDAAPLLIRLEPFSPRPQGVVLNLAISAIGMGGPDKALIYLDRAQAESDATLWDIRFHRAVAFAQLDRLPEALALYRIAEMERPDDPRLQFNLAVTCDTLGLYPEALTHYEAALRIQPEPSGTDRQTIIQRIRTIRRYLGTAPSVAQGQ